MIVNACINPSSANSTKWSNTVKQFVGKLLTNCLSVFDHFVGLALTGLRCWQCSVKSSHNTSYSCSLFQFQYFGKAYNLCVLWFLLMICLITLLKNRLLSRHLPVQSQQWTHKFHICMFFFVFIFPQIDRKTCRKSCRKSGTETSSRSLYFLKKTLFEVKANGWLLSFNIFW